MTTIEKIQPIDESGEVTRNPWNEPIRCPLILYTILVILGVVINLSAAMRAPSVNRQGMPISNTQKWTAFIIGLLVYLIIAYLFGKWMYNLCKSGQTLNSWLVFILAILFPLILAIIIGIIVSAFLGISYFLFGQP